MRHITFIFQAEFPSNHGVGSGRSVSACGFALAGKGSKRHRRVFSAAVLACAVAAASAIAQEREATCEADAGNPSLLTCAGSDHSGIRISPQEVPAGGLSLQVTGGANPAQTTTIIGKGLQLPLPTGQTIEINGHGISLESDADSALSVSLDGHARVRAHSREGHGINVTNSGSGPIDVKVSGSSITTGGQDSHGINAQHSGTGDIFITLGDGADISARRDGSDAIQGFQSGDGSVTVRIDDGAIVKGSPNLGRGIAAFLTNDSNGGRIRIENEGTILGGLRSDGILAWARRRSGHIGFVMEDGGRQEPEEFRNDAARTNPLIHIVSNGIVEVGAPIVIGLPPRPQPESVALALNLGAINALLNPPLPQGGAGIRALVIDIVDLIDHVAVPRVLTQEDLQIIADSLSIPGLPPLTPAQAAAVVGAVGPDGSPLPVKLLSPAEANVIREILDDTGEDRLTEALSVLTPAVSPAYTEAYKNRIREFEMTYNSGDILIEVTGGSVTSHDGFGIQAGYPIPASKKNGEVRIIVSRYASVTGEVDGIRLATGGIVDGRRQHFVHIEGEVAGRSNIGVHPVAGGTVTVARTGKVSGERAGIRFSGGTGNGEFPITNNTVRVDGEVVSTGSAANHAGIQLEGGGTVVVGPQARIEAESGIAILGEPWSADPDAAAEIDVVIEPGDSVEERIQGVIRNLPGAGGSRRAPRIFVRPGDRAVPLTPGVKVPLGAWDVVSEQGEGGDLSFSSEYGARARLYEALPFVLADQARLPPYGGRVGTAPEMAAGPWIRPVQGGGKWSAKLSSTGEAAYEHDRFRLEGGIDLPLSETFSVGVSGHTHDGSAEVPGVGEVTLASRGLGLSGTVQRGRFYVNGRIVASQLDVNVNAVSTGAIASDVRGSSRTAGFEIGRRFESGGFVFRPRIGLTWTSVSLDEFTAPAAAGGGEVALEDGNSMRARIGVLAAAAGTDARGVSFALDLEHHLRGADKSMTVGGSKLTAHTHPTILHAGVGGRLELGDRAPSLKGQLGFSTAGRDSYDITAEIGMQFRF